MDTAPAPIATVQLSSFHSSRSGLYRAVADLLRSPPRTYSPNRWTLHDSGGDLFGEQRARSHLRSGLAFAEPATVCAEHARLFEGPHPALDLRCPLASCAARQEAFAATGVRPAGARTDELELLSALADRTARALSACEMPEAAGLCEIQGRFLSGHAGACLMDLAQEIVCTGAPFYGAVGRALGWLVADDLRLLGIPTEDA